jgi:hypothetical protein
MLFNRHLKVPWEHASLIELQTVLKLKVGVCTHEMLNKVLTEPVSPLGVDPTLDRSRVELCSHVEAEQGRSTTLRANHMRSGQGLKKCLDPDMDVNFHALFVEGPRFTIVHVTV